MLLDKPFLAASKTYINTVKPHTAEHSNTASYFSHFTFDMMFHCTYQTDLVQYNQ